MIGLEIFNLVQEMYPICRSITGNGVRDTLDIIKKHIPGLKIFEIATGTNVFDWAIPKEWNVKDAYVIDPDGKKIIDFQKSNIHLVGYSIPINSVVSLKELQDHLHSIPEQPDAIPYVTSYYEERWGFCISEKQRKSLRAGDYYVYIDSSLTEGSLTYGEIIIPGERKQEILLSTYICHPSLANDNLSGPAVTTYLAKYLMDLKYRKYTYRIIFIPETIGAIAYLSKNLEVMRKNTIAGFNITCIGDDRTYSFLPSRHGNTLADRTALHVMEKMNLKYIKYSYLERGSDERQYCSPGIDLPIVSIMRSKYGEYPEYHTSLDNLNLVTASGLMGGYEVLKTCLDCIKNNEKLKTTVLGEPQLGKRGLYPTLSIKNKNKYEKNIIDLLAYCDGDGDLIEIAEKINTPLWELYPLVLELKRHSLLKEVE